MSGVWVFRDGVVKLVENPNDYNQLKVEKELVHTESNEVVTCYAVLERMLTSLGWERYYDDPYLFQFHKPSSLELISLPMDFNKLKSIHMYDIVVKNRNYFRVRNK